MLAMRCVGRSLKLRTMIEVTITKAPTDPVATRVSVGGKPDIGFYCTFRGGMDESIAALEHAVHAMKALKASGVQPQVDHRYRQLGAN